MGGSYRAGQLGRSKKRCACVGCSATLYRGSHSFDLGFCRAHAHAEHAPKVARMYPAGEVRVHLVNVVTSTTGEVLRMPVSLPREPWLGPGVAA